MTGSEPKKGFSGLSELASEIDEIDHLADYKSSSKQKPQASHPSQSTSKTSSSRDSSRKVTKAPPLLDTFWGPWWKMLKNDHWKWIFGITMVIFIIGIANNILENTTKQPPNTTMPRKNENIRQISQDIVNRPRLSQNVEMQYEKPPVGTSIVLSVEQIRWCLREDMLIETMRNLINSNAGVDEYNKIVEDYNRRCAKYRYQKSTLERAQNDVGTERYKITSEAIRYAEKLNSIKSKPPNAQSTREAQQLLSELGYDPGPIDGMYGHLTGAAVKAFQRDAKLKQNGWIDHDLLSALRIIVKEQKSRRSAQTGQSIKEVLVKQSLPESGSIFECTSANREAPFEIKAAHDNHYLVKLVDVYTSATVLTVFVRGGTTANIDVPLGTYEVRYASGQFWYGYKHLFGPKTAYNKAEKTFKFEVVGDQLTGFTITLYKVPHGNLPTINIKPTEF